MSVSQIAALIEFLEGRPELALGRSSRTKEGRCEANRLWVECSNILNSVSPDGVQKTAEQWRMFYNEFKHKLIKKLKGDKSEINATGGEPPTSITLTPLQQRLYSILERHKGLSSPGVRRNPTSSVSIILHHV